jgi:hypothetical protein
MKTLDLSALSSIEFEQAKRRWLRLEGKREAMGYSLNAEGTTFRHVTFDAYVMRDADHFACHLHVRLQFVPPQFNVTVQYIRKSADAVGLHAGGFQLTEIPVDPPIVLQALLKDKRKAKTVSKYSDFILKEYANFIALFATPDRGDDLDDSTYDA